MGQDEETMRKGPWTEHEDFQLVFHVHMFGDRRWDFIANVSGLKRTGKSCRLRWVNYLNPGLKRGKLAPHEERHVLELHSKFGNRWSKIARKLPGRTDNEIKNYWRTHMRKKAQEKKRVTSRSPSPSLSHCSSSSSICTSQQPIIDSMPMIETKERSFYDTGGVKLVSVMKGKSNYTNDNCKTDTNRARNSSEEQEGCYSMEDIWKDIGSLEDDSIKPVFDLYSEMAPSLTTWDNYVSTSWMMGGQEESSMNTFPITSQQFSSRLTH